MSCLQGELEETLVLLTLRDTEITKVGLSGDLRDESCWLGSDCSCLTSLAFLQRDMLMDKMKSAHVENHNMIEVHYDSANMQKRDWNLKLYL